MQKKNWLFRYLKPKQSHFKAAKRILKYLKGTSSVALWYPSHSPIHLIGYSDSDFAGWKLDRKSTTGTCHLLGSNLISWNSKKQPCVALSTVEAEYIAARSCCAQILWLKLILPVDRNAGNCLVKGSTCAPLLTSVPLRDPPQEPAKQQSGAAAADRTPTLKSVTESPNTKRTRTVQILSHSKLYNSQA